MFVCTIKWNKKTAVIILIAAALILALLTIAISGSGNSSKAGVNSPADAAEFLESLGWEVDSETSDDKDVVIPTEFSKIYEDYNSLQKAQGYDLSKYKGKQVKIYTFNVKNYTGYTGCVVADIYIFDGEVIGGDIHSLELDGFIHGLCRNGK